MEQGEEEVEVIHSWSAPRSLSTTLMYSFAQRDDTEVLDEALYAAFLRVTGVERPYIDELLSKMESDGSKVVNNVIFGPGGKKYRFCKIAKQRVPGLPVDLLKKGKHLILIRNPLNILQSLEKVVPASFLELGLAELVAIYSELCELGGPPSVIDTADLEEDPEATIRSICEDLDIPFQSSMLKWEAGPKPYDGIWAPWWYKSVHKSSGFKQVQKFPEPFSFTMYDLLEQSLPFYNLLRRHVKRTSSLLKTNLSRPNLPVPSNEKLLAWVGYEILPRESAKVSVFDSVVQGGDSVWEGLRVYNGKIFKLDEHLDRLLDSAKALAFNNVPTRKEIEESIFKTLIRNGMFDNAHIRLSLTRGKKVTSGMSPAFNLYGCTLIVLPEWKPPVYDNTKGITLVTATTPRNSPNNLDSKIHHNNFLNNILAKIEGNNANADDAIMLDKDGYVSETNATNIMKLKHIDTPLKPCERSTLDTATMADAELNPNVPPYLHLVSAFLAMEPSDHLISLARVCGGGLVTERVQKFIWDHCVNKSDGRSCARYLKNFLKKLIVEIESNNGVLLDELYEQYAEYMTSLKEYDPVKGKVCKCISFLFQDGCLDLPSCPTSMKLIIPLQCSLNMLEGDTGCSIWPSSLFLSEFILSFPEIFSYKSCFEVGSGVGLVGICLANVRASKIVLSDGDLTTLSNMKQNLELNKLSTDTHVPKGTAEDSKMVKCISMPWESATESELQGFMPDIVLGADVIYDPLHLPYLVRVLVVLLNPMKPCCQKQEESCEGSLCDDYNSLGNNARRVEVTYTGPSNARSREGPVAYIASVIRNIDTFNCFLALANQANLTIIDLTDERRPFNLLPYMKSYDRSSIRLFHVSCKVIT